VKTLLADYEQTGTLYWLTVWKVSYGLLFRTFLAGWVRYQFVAGSVNN
jgi:hypothetical protein